MKPPGKFAKNVHIVKVDTISREWPVVFLDHCDIATEREEEMKKLFISQPMNGKSDDEIQEERKAAIKMAEIYLDESVEVIDSFFQSAPADARPLWFLGKSLELLSTADVAYFAPGWEDARGCKIEHICAVEYGIDRIE